MFGVRLTMKLALEKIIHTCLFVNGISLFPENVVIHDDIVNRITRRDRGFSSIVRRAHASVSPGTYFEKLRNYWNSFARTAVSLLNPMSMAPGL